MEGASIGPYLITRKIGEGGMGTVWVGEHTLLGRKAAIKMLLPEFTGREEIVQRFFNEARAVTAIADPGIVQVFDFGHAHGSAYIVMELLDGEAMDARLRRIGRFAPADAIRLMKQVATSLGAAHAKGVIHRDLKPENIFIVGDPAVTGGERSKILDFGIAKLTGDETSKHKTRTGMVMGTPVYMSPEQCRGAATIDARSDVYALGCVLFTMVAGRPPFESDSTGDLIIMHVRDAPPPVAAFVPGFPPDLDAVIARCLEKDQNRRFQTTAELVHALAGAEAAMFGMQMPGGGGPGGYQQQPTPFPYQPQSTPYQPQSTPYQPHGTPAPHDAHTRMASAVHGATPSPTTLGLASGSVAASPPRRKGVLFAALAVAVLAIGGGVAVIAGGGNKNAAEPVAAPAPPPVTAPVDAGTVVMPVAADAALADPPTPAVAVEAVDAGVAATAQTKVVGDKHKPPKRGGTKQGGSNASSSSTSGTVNRGD